MGKSYSYSIVVEQGGELLINDRSVPLPADVASKGDDPLGWALDQVRASYASRYSQETRAELNLSVRDRRPGGLVRRARFTHPDSGIDLDTFLGRRQLASAAGTSAPSSADSSAALGRAADAPPRQGPVEEEQPSAPSTSREAMLRGEDERSAEQQAETEGEVSAAGVPVQVASVSSKAQPLRRAERSREHRGAAAHEMREGSDLEAREGAEDRSPTSSPRATAVATIPKQPPQESAESSYEDRVRKERGWKKLPREKSSRPQVGSAENEGRSKKLGLLAEAQRQKTLRIVGIVVLVVAVIVGFRIFNGGTEYEAVCVDQRTMTRTVTGVACENESDTNHRWWFTAQDEDLPGPGDSINTQEGTFDEPTGSKDTINWNVESDEVTG